MKRFQIHIIIALISFNLGCVVEEEEDPQPKDINVEIQAALDSNAPLEDILTNYSKSQLYGKTYKGGFIAYVNESDKVVLIAAREDAANDTDFYDQGSFFTNEFTSSNFGTGEANTQVLVNELGSSGNVAALCTNYTSQGYSDWFLPSSAELGYIRANVYQKGIGNFPGGSTSARYYWHSTLRQSQGTCPEGIQFVTGTKTPCLSSASVRPARYYFY